MERIGNSHDLTASLPASEPSVIPLISERWRGSVRVAWIIMAALAFGIFLISIPAYILGLGQSVDWPALTAPATPTFALTVLAAVISIAAALICFALAAIIFWRKPMDRMAVYASFTLLLYGFASAGPLEKLAVYDPAIGDFAQAALFMSAIPWVVFFSLFPNGRFVPRWSRWLPILSALWAAGLVAFHPFGATIDNPIVAVIEILWIVSLAMLVVYAQIWRYRHVSNPVERQQTKWIVFGLLISLTLFTLSTIPWVLFHNSPPGTVDSKWVDWLVFALEVVWWIMICVLPISMTIAVLHYRLWDIDIIINRTLVYVSLTAIIVGMYVVIVGSVSELLQTGSNLPLSLFATGIVAMSFQPLRARLQRWVNRLMYGERDEPYAVLGRLAERLEVVVASEQVLPTIVETVAQALKLPYAAIALKIDDDYNIWAAYSSQTGDMIDSATASEVLPLVYQSETVGQLVLAPRGRGESFSRADQQLLETIARQASVAAYNVRLMEDLQRSRERIVTTREEERRRLRRDLHDGLGPALASVSFKLDATYNLVDHDSDAARNLLTEIKAQIQTSLSDIRRIAYNLRPPALDELGLIGALREHLASHNQAHELQIVFETPERMPALSAAVELAVYRIVLEAVTNVTRHAHAHHCTVKISLCDALCIEVIDDGQGLPDGTRMGVGLTAMRERAAELGGKCIIERAPEGGTRVYAQLPSS